MAKADVLKTLGERIKSARVAAGKSQSDISELIDVSKQSISAWENGESPPTLINLIRFAAVVKQDAASFLSMTDEGLGAYDPVTQRLAASSKLVPLYGVQIAGGILMGTLSASKSEPDRYVATFSKHSAESIAITIKDRTNYPRFKVGDIATIDPEKEPEPGLFVFAYADKDFVFRRYMPTRHGTHLGANLVAEDSKYPPIVMGPDDVILGVMGEHTTTSHD